MCTIRVCTNSIHLHLDSDFARLRPLHFQQKGAGLCVCVCGGGEGMGVCVCEGMRVASPSPLTPRWMDEWMGEWESMCTTTHHTPSGESKSSSASDPSVVLSS